MASGQQSSEVWEFKKKIQDKHVQRFYGSTMVIRTVQRPLEGLVVKVKEGHIEPYNNL